MNHFVPVFDVDHEDHSIPSSSSGLHRQKSMHDDQILELLWQNGQVVVQSQSQNPRLPRKSSPPPQPKFLPEDEPMSWLQYPFEDPPFDRELADLFSHPPPPPPPPPPPSSPPRHHRKIQVPIRSDSVAIASSGNNELRESMVDSSDTPAIWQKPNFPVVTRNAAVEITDRGNQFRERLIGADRSGIRENYSTSGVSRELDTYDFTLTSSLGGSGTSLSASATADLMTLPTADDRKRKGREHVDAAITEYQSEDVEIESYEPKKQTRGGANAKRSRAAEVHNLSERRRRDRINEKMKALQELIPRSSKTDKASMLDEAIVYLKSLQMQVQMMSMGCGMVPMMFPGMQQYMGMGMAQQMMPFSSALPSSAMQTSGPTSHLNPRFPPLQPFQMPSIPGNDPSRIQQASNQGEFNTARIPSLADPYQQCTSIQQTPMQIPRTDQTLASQVQTEEAKAAKNSLTG